MLSSRYAYDADTGWVFPTRSRSKPFKVIPISETKEYRVDDDGVRYQ